LKLLSALLTLHLKDNGNFSSLKMVQIKNSLQSISNLDPNEKVRNLAEQILPILN